MTAPTEGFARRALALRAMLCDDSASAGDQALKLLEEYLERLAYRYGYVGDGSLGRYANFSVDGMRSMKTLSSASTCIRGCVTVWRIPMGCRPRPIWLPG